MWFTLKSGVTGEHKTHMFRDVLTNQDTKYTCESHKYKKCRDGFDASHRFSVLLFSVLNLK